jgi:hypothetical protein
VFPEIVQPLTVSVAKLNYERCSQEMIESLLTVHFRYPVLCDYAQRIPPRFKRIATSQCWFTIHEGKEERAPVYLCHGTRFALAEGAVKRHGAANDLEALALSGLYAVGWCLAINRRLEAASMRQLPFMEGRP